jgi:proline iminopeptidase
LKTKERIMSDSSKRETVLDRLAHPLEYIILGVPDLPPLCDSLPLTRQRVDIGDCTLYCEIEGHGTPIVLLHGGPGATHHYFHPVFSDAAAFSQVIYYDQRGCGSSDYEPRDGYTISQAVDDLDRLREALGFDKWVVLGHSYGGVLAQCYSVRYPQHVSGLVLVGASYAFSDLPFDCSRQFNGEFQFPEERAFISKLYGDNSLTWVQRIYNGHRNGDWRRQSFYRPTDDQIARLARYDTSDEAFQPAMSKTISRVTLDGAFIECPLPTLIMEGRWDLSAGESHAKRLPPYFKDATLRFYDQAGHNPFDDEPEAFFAELRQFMDNLPEVSEVQVAEWKESVADSVNESGLSD